MKTLISLTVGLIITSYSYGQTITPQTINSTGGSERKGNVRIDWSVGEMSLVNKLTDDYTGLIITNGLIQPYTDNPSSVNNAVAFDRDEIRILPNPTRGKLEINIDTKQQGRISISLYDALGTLLYVKQVIGYGYGLIETIEMGRFTHGTYMLKVELIPAGGFVKKRGAFKITKID